MRGRVLGFAGGSGVLLALNGGNRYVFAASDWKGQRHPYTGQDVEFETTAHDTIASVTPIPSPEGATEMPDGYHGAPIARRTRKGWLISLTIGAAIVAILAVGLVVVLLG